MLKLQYHEDKHYKKFICQALQKQKEIENRKLMEAVGNRNRGVVRKLLEKGADVNIKTTGFSALELALATEYDCTRRKYSYDTEVVKMLVDAGADVNIQFIGLLISGWTPLTHASSEGLFYIVRCLLNAGADVNVPNKDGKPALLLAADKGHTEIVKMLVENGAVLNPESNYDCHFVNGCLISTLAIAACRGNKEIVKMLHKAGGDLDKALILLSGLPELTFECHLGSSTAEVTGMRLLIEVGADVDGKKGWEPPLAVVTTNEKARILIEAGANIDL